MDDDIFVMFPEQLQNDDNQSEQQNVEREQTDENDFIANLQIRIRQALVELQTKRRNEVIKDCSDEAVVKKNQELIATKREIQELKRDMERAVGAVNRLAQERVAEAKKCADLQIKIQLLEGENEAMRTRLRELVSNNEELGRRETIAKGRLAGHDSFRVHIQRQLERLNRIVDMLQENHQRMESDLKRLENEVTAAKGHREMYRSIEEHQHLQLELMKENLKNAYDDIAKLTAKINGDERVMNIITTKEYNFEQKIKIENDLQMKIKED